MTPAFCGSNRAAFSLAVKTFDTAELHYGDTTSLLGSFFGL